MARQIALSMLLLPSLGLALGACYGDAPRLSESGQGLPEVTVDFPLRAEAGSTQEAVFGVSNPGPGDIGSLVVAFARAGDPDLPEPIVDAGSRGANEAVVSVEPEPLGVSDDGVVYRFEGIEEGKATTIAFRLEVPDISGTAANAVQVYDGADIERATGVRLETTVGQ
ncbi:MAG: hypothetical protein H0U16_09560 [Actinobacteria bacterium]|nr:hypothetical protein [Actinomycetota bacterium]